MFDPYHKWLGIPKEQRPPTYYQLLGVAADETDAEVIEEAAVRQTAHVRTYQIGPHAAECTRLLNEIAQAKLTLIHPAKRQAYDQHLAAQRVSQVTAKAPAAAAPAAPAAAFEFDDDEPRDDAPKRAPRRDLNIARPAGSAPLWIALGVGGGVLLLLIAVVVIMVAVRAPMPEPPGIAKKDDKRKERNPLLKIREHENPQPGPGPMPPPAGQGVVIGPGQLRQAPAGTRSIRVPGPVVHLALSPDGNTIAVAGNGAATFNLNTGAAIAKLLPPQQGDAPPTPIVFHPDGKRVLVAHASEPAVLLADAMTGQALARLESPGPVTALAVTPDGKRALGGHGAGVILWDLDNRQEVKRWNLRQAGDIAVSSDGARAMMVDVGGLANAFDLQTLQGIPGSSTSNPLHMVRFAPGTHDVVIGLANGLLLCHQGLPARRTQFQNRGGLAGNATAFAFASGGTLFLTGGKDGVIRVWDPTPMWQAPLAPPLAEWPGHQAEVTRIAVEAQDRFAVSADKDGAIYIWPLPKDVKAFAALPGGQAPAPPRPVPVVAQPLPRVAVPRPGWLQFNGKVLFGDPRMPWVTDDKNKRDLPARGHNVSFKKDVRYHIELRAIKLGLDPLVLVCNERGEQLAFDDDSGGYPNARLQFTPPEDGRYLIYAAAFAGQGEFSLSITEASKLPPAGPVAVPQPPPGLRKVITSRVSGVHGLAWAPDGKSFFVGGLRVQHWDLSGAMLKQYLQRGQAGADFILRLTPNGERLLVADATMLSPQLYEVSTGRELGRLERGGIQAVALAPDGSQAVLTFQDKTMVLWDLGNQQVLREVTDPIAPVTAVAYARDGKEIFCSRGNGQAQWLDAETWQVKRIAKLPASVWAPPAATADGLIWALPTHQLQQGISLYEPATSGFHGNLPIGLPKQAAFCGDDQLLLTRRHGQRPIYVWDVVRRAVVAEWDLSDHINDFAVNPDRTMILAVTRQGDAYVWPLPRNLEDVK